MADSTYRVGVLLDLAEVIPPPRGGYRYLSPVLLHTADGSVIGVDRPTFQLWD